MMMRKDMIEAMARGIAKANFVAPDVKREWPHEGSCWISFEDDAQAALSALEAMGCVVVPREPTEGMIGAGIMERHEQSCPEAWTLATANIYRAMIAAASPLPAQGRG